jgi:hypothetical protein
MKKLISFILTILLAIVFTGCSPSASDGAGANLNIDLGNGGAGLVGGKTSSSANIVTPQPSGASISATDNGIVASFDKFTNTEMTSISLIANKIQDGEDQEITDTKNVCSTVYYATAFIMPIEAISGGDKLSTLEQAGYSDFNITQKGDVYTIAYTFSETNYSNEAQYDSATDSMKATMYDASKTPILTFEYSLQGSAYAAQLFSPSSSGGYQICTAYVDGTNISAFGAATAASAPQSIYKNSSLGMDFVKTGSFYCVLSGNNLSVVDNGTTKTY